MGGEGRNKKEEGCLIIVAISPYLLERQSEALEVVLSSRRHHVFSERKYGVFHLMYIVRHDFSK